MNSTKRVYKTLLGRWLGRIKQRLSLSEDNATQEEVVGNISKSTEFRGTNLWVLICATFIASLGLNVNSTAVIIGAMLISPLMGPIMGLGLGLGINDFQLMKKSLRNFSWMVIVGVLTSTFYFLITPYSSAQSELLARTSPTAYDVLIAFVGGFAGMLAQTRTDRTGTVISGVAIATALMPPLCTMGYGLANLEVRFIFGAAYLFLINAVFIAIASYIMVILLKYEKKEHLDKASSKRKTRWVWVAAVAVIIPSMIMTINITRQTAFEGNVDRYVNSVFQFNKTMIVDYSSKYRYDGKLSSVELKLVGEPLTQNVIDNARAQMDAYGLHNTELVIKQADENDRVDFSKIQKSYAEIIDEKNSTIRSLEGRLSSLQVIDTIATADISRELAYVTENIKSVSLAKHVGYTTSGTPGASSILCVVTPEVPSFPVNTTKIRDWLTTRLKNENITVIVEQ